MTLARAGRLARIGMHVMLIPLTLALCAILGWTAGDYHWPYAVQAVEVEPDPAAPGSVVRIITTRTYLDDCDLRFDRQLESVDDPRRPPVQLPTEETRTPWRYSGKPQAVRIAIPPDFPCGSAQLRTQPSASCNWIQVGFLRQRTRDVLTPFEIACTP